MRVENSVTSFNICCLPNLRVTTLLRCVHSANWLVWHLSQAKNGTTTPYSCCNIYIYIPFTDLATNSKRLLLLVKLRATPKSALLCRQFFNGKSCSKIKNLLQQQTALRPDLGIRLQGLFSQFLLAVLQPFLHWESQSRVAARREFWVNPP